MLKSTGLTVQPKCLKGWVMCGTSLDSLYLRTMCPQSWLLWFETES